MADKGPQPAAQGGARGPFARFLASFRGHYGWVLATLLLLLAIYPFAREDGWLSAFLDLALLAVIVSSLLVSASRRVVQISLAVAIVAEVAAGAARYLDAIAFESPGRILRILVLFAATTVVLRDVIRSRRVTMDTVFGAASVYLLLAFCWSSVFIALETIQPGSFQLLPTGGTDGMTLEAQLVYYSLITLTTVGYGDITPSSPQAAMLSALEGLIGQLYIAITLARLVALEISQRRTRNGQDDP
jgi:hypothetical protein